MVIRDEAASSSRLDPFATPATGRSSRISRRIGMLGPAFVAAVAYVDPGNVAANLQAGTKYGYLLVWVLVVAVAAAGVVQFLSAKLGLATGMSLPGTGRAAAGPFIPHRLLAAGRGRGHGDRSRRGRRRRHRALPAVRSPAAAGRMIAGVVSLGLLVVQSRRGQRTFERMITGFLLIIAIGFLAGLFVSPPSAAGVAAGLLPRFEGMDSVLLAAAMLGATVMPHAVYLHSALTRDRFGRIDPGPIRARLLAATKTDVVFAMVLAGSVNIAMLLLAASGLRGQDGVDTIEGAYAAISSTLGPAIGILFAVGSAGLRTGIDLCRQLRRRRHHGGPAGPPGEPHAAPGDHPDSGARRAGRSAPIPPPSWSSRRWCCPSGCRLSWYR